MWLYPKAVRFLEIPEYRCTVLMGLVLCLGTKTESTVGTFIRLPITPALSIPLASAGVVKLG